VTIGALVKCHAIIFMQKDLAVFDATLQNFIAALDNHIARLDKRYLEQGYPLAISNIIALLGYNSETNPLRSALTAAEVSTVTYRNFQTSL
jgi:hypothetical protein